jgi:G3E family GTPase
MADASPAPIPVTLVTGFLGSGKTTLLQRLLRDPAFADTAVLINELGEIALDHQLLERIDETMVVLKSGCVCCTIRGELAAAIKNLHEQRELGLVPPFWRLVIESTGLADPFPILSTVRADPVLRHHFKLANVITTVDAVNGMRQFDDHPESVKQAAVADRLIVTKTDLATTDAAASLAARLRRLNPVAPLLPGTAAIDAGALLSGDAFGDAGTATTNWFPDNMPLHDEEHAQGDHHHHHNEIRAVALTVAEPLDWAAFGVWLTMLLHRHGDAVLRVKGILNIVDAETPVALHGVQQLVHAPKHLEAWPDADRRSRLVFIVKGLEPAAIERSLRRFCRLPSGAVALAAAQ